LAVSSDLVGGQPFIFASGGNPRANVTPGN
ncbi:MAG: hypothetical protein ACI9VS_001415, partial [Candidatus Binatia bacterium]